MSKIIRRFRPCVVLLMVFSLVVLAARAAVAAEHAETCRYCRAASQAAALAASEPLPRRYAPDRQVDVTHIKLEVTPDFANHGVAGTATLRFAPIAKPLETLRLDAADLRVAEVRSSHAVRDWSADAESITIVFDPPIAADAAAWVEIDYAAEPLEGLYFRTTDMGVPQSDVHCWTQGETHEARHWFPCFDYPNERSSTELVCHVPSDMTVVSNGRLVSQTTSDDGATASFHWLQEQPHVSYLICFVAGRLAKLAGQHGDLPLAFYTQPSKAAQAKLAFADTAEIISFYEQETGVPFPWDKYDQATIADFMWGGMENTTLTTLTQRTLYDDPADQVRAGRSRSLNAHEVAHQWFGDYVTCKDWSHLWLNEGFATFYALLFEGQKYGRDALLYGLYLDARDDIMLPENAADVRPIVYRQYVSPFEQFDYRNYPKASWVLHMLRSQVGEVLYRQAIHTYLQRHALGSVATDDLRAVFEELSGKPLDRFFDQWLYHGGQPELTVTYKWLPKEQLAHVAVEQTQASGAGVLLFEFPTTLRFVVDGRTVDKPIVVSQRKQDFYVPLSAKPQVVRFDANYEVLAKVAFDKSDALLEADMKNTSDVVGRLLACEALVKRPTDASVELLSAALVGDPFFGVRQTAARALREIRSEAAVAALVRGFDQPDARVRRAVAEELALSYDDAAHAKLLAIAADDRELPSVAAVAVVGLGRWSDDASAGAIRAALASRSFQNDRAAAAMLAIRETNDASWGPELMTALGAREADVDAADLMQGFVTLAQISQRGRRQAEAYEFLAAYLDHPRVALRQGAIEALGVLRDPRARVLLEPFARKGQNSRLAETARRALLAVDAGAEFAPDEVRELRREIRELRESQAELKRSLNKVETTAGSADGGSGDE